MNSNDIMGWCNFFDLYQEAVDRTESGIFAEVGVFQGQSSVYLGQKIKESKKDIKLLSIDLFPTKDELIAHKDIGAGQSAEYQIIMDLPKSLLDTFVENTRNCNVSDVIVPIKSDSMKAASIFPDNYLSMVFLDDCHFYDYVLQELEVWWPKVVSGGMYMGHDFYHGVERAVNEFFGKLGISVQRRTDCWVVYKE